MINRSAARAGVALLVLVLAAAFLAALVNRASVAVPFKDELLFQSLYAALAVGQLPTAANLFAAYNGHPYLVLNLVLSGTLLSGAPWQWMMYGQVILLSAASLLLLHRYRNGRSHHALLFAIGVAVTVLTPRQWENLYWGMQIVFALFLFSSIFAFHAVDRFARLREPSAVVSAMLFALLASVCNGAGILALLISGAGLLWLRPSKALVAFVAAAMVVGVSAFLVSQGLAQKAPIGGLSPGLPEIIRHESAMVLHAFGFAREGSALWLPGVLAAFVVVMYSLLEGIRRWRENMLGLSLLALGIGISLAVTYARLKSGTVQPDASRYLTLLIPIPLGCLCILMSGARAWALGTLALALSIVWGLAATEEWSIGPYRKSNLLQEKASLCTRGITPAEFKIRDHEALVDVMTLFCGTQANPYQWSRAPLAVGSTSVANSNVVDPGQWQWSDPAQSGQGGFRVYASSSSSPGAGSISVRLSRGDRVFYRSGVVAQNQILKIQGSRLNRAKLPATSEWVLLDFSSMALPERPFVVTFSDAGGDAGDWSEIAVKLD